MSSSLIPKGYRQFAASLITSHARASCPHRLVVVSLLQSFPMPVTLGATGFTGLGISLPISRIHGYVTLSLNGRFYSLGMQVCYQTYVCMYVCMYGHHMQQSMDQPGKVANPARGQLNKENNIPLSPCVPENLVSRDGFSRPVPRQPAHLHTQAESGAYLRDSSLLISILRLNLVLTYGIPPEFRGGVHL